MTKKIEFSTIVENIRIDKFLSEIFRNFSRSHFAKLIAAGNVFVNNSKIKASYILSKQDKITLHLTPPKKMNLEPENLHVEIIYQDNFLAVINKPAGMVVHPSAGHFDKTLVNALLYHLDNLSGINHELRPGIVHRLDKDTSGLMVVAKNDFAHMKLSEQFKKRKVKKFYNALVFGKVIPEKGRIETKLARDRKNRLKFSSYKDIGKTAITNYKTEKVYKNFTLLNIHIETGRTHQIRVHFSELGHPLVGDTLYGKKKLLNMLKQEERKHVEKLKRVFLHSYKLVFVHPESNKCMSFRSNLPVELKKFLKDINEIC